MSTTLHESSVVISTLIEKSVVTLPSKLHSGLPSATHIMFITIILKN